MHTAYRLKIFSNKFLCQLVMRLVAFLIVFNLTGCTCNNPNYKDLIKAVERIISSVKMNVDKKLLIGTEDKVKVTFHLDNLNNLMDIEDFKLRVTIVEQENLVETTKKSEISYKRVIDNQIVTSESFEKPLSEFITLAGLDRENSLAELKVKFKLRPIDEAIRLKLHFELVGLADNNLQTIEVEWIKSKIIIMPLLEVTEKDASFSIKNLGEDIQDLSKIKLRIQGLQEGASFVFEKTNLPEAMLSDLLPGTTQLAKNQKTNSIKIKADLLNEKTSLFSILILDKDDGPANSHPLLQEGVGNTRLKVDPKMKAYKKELEDTLEKEHLDEEKLKNLQKEQELLNEKINQLHKDLKKEKKSVRQKLKATLKLLKEEKKQELIGKTEEEKIIIKKKYAKRKRKILADAGNEFMINSLKYMGGFGNAVVHDAVGIPLYKSKNQPYSNGKHDGHKTIMIAGRIETVVGTGVMAAGVGLIIAGTGTLGTTIGAGAPLIGVGAALLGHSVFVTDRAQGNLEKEKRKKEKAKREKEQEQRKVPL